MSTTPYPNPQAAFYQQYETVRRDEIVGILLALFLGTFGIHHFYLRRTGLGILYCIFCWTGIPSILGFIECFFMPGRVREFNAMQAAGIAATLGIQFPGWGQPVSVWVNASSGVSPGPAVSGQPETAQPGAGHTGNMLMACLRCRQTNPPNARFCSACGQPL